MTEVLKTAEFDGWLSSLQDRQAVARITARITARIDRLVAGNAGDTKRLGSGVSELRIDYGPGVPPVLHAARQGARAAPVRGRQAHPGCGYQAGVQAR